MLKLVAEDRVLRLSAVDAVAPVEMELPTVVRSG
jgi:hypothetical protein